MVEPVTTITAALGLAKAAGEIGKKLYALGKEVKDRDVKQQIDEILDQVREVKQAASTLEDENRELREKVRFKSDDYEFHNPYWVDKEHPDRALCPKCFAKEIVGPLTPEYAMNGRLNRRCLVCGYPVEIDPPSMRTNKSMTNMRGI
jgi:hypothetical protein